MPNIRMTDTTHHRDYGSLRAGQVYAVSDEDAAHLIEMGIAVATKAKTSAELAQLAAEPAEEDASPRAMPAITRADVAGLTGEEPSPRPGRAR